MHWRLDIVFILVLIVGGMYYFAVSDTQTPMKENNQPKKENIILLGNTEIAVELADTPEKRQKGLSGRENLSQGSGMLFIFDEPGNYQFWMKDMKFPIDIIWIGEDMKVVYIAENLAPDTFPKVFSPPTGTLSRWVLEVPAGFVADHKIQIGDLVHIGAKVVE